MLRSVRSRVVLLTIAVAVVAGSPALVILTGDTARAVSVPGCLPLP